MFDMRHELNSRRTKIFDMGYEKISSLDLSNFSDICDALKLCRDPTSPVEIELLFHSCWNWNSKWPTNLKIVEIPSLLGYSKFLPAQNIFEDRLLNFRHPKIFDMRHELNLRRTKIFDMGYEKFQGSTYRTFRTSVMLWNCVGTLLLPLKLNFYFSCWNRNSKWPTNRQKILVGGQPKTLAFSYPPNGGV